MPTQALPDVLTQLSERGFTDQCRANGGGVQFMRGQSTFAPEELVVEEVVRLEGTSAPDEQIAVYALSSPDGNMRGSYTVPHGIEVDPHDSDVISRLKSTPQTVEPDSQSESLQPQY